LPTRSTFDLQALWTIVGAPSNPPYPIEPVVSQRDLTSDPTHLFRPYRPRGRAQLPVGDAALGLVRDRVGHSATREIT
jgi:hypothetical protein